MCCTVQCVYWVHCAVFSLEIQLFFFLLSIASIEWETLKNISTRFLTSTQRKIEQVRGKGDYSWTSVTSGAFVVLPLYLLSGEHYNTVYLQSAYLLKLRARICKPFKEPRNQFPALAKRYDNPIYRAGPQGYIGWRNRFLDFINVYKNTVSGQRTYRGTKFTWMEIRTFRSYFSRICWTLMFKNLLSSTYILSNLVRRIYFL